MQIYNSFQEMVAGTGALNGGCAMSVFNAVDESVKANVLAAVQDLREQIVAVQQSMPADGETGPETNDWLGDVFQKLLEARQIVGGISRMK